MITNKNVINLQIQNGTNDFLSALATAGTTVDTLAASRTGAFDLSNNGLDWNNTTKQWNDASGNVVDSIRFVTKKADSTYFMSDVIDWSKVVKITRKNYVAATEQITTIGYNGTSGSINTIDDNTYVLDVTFKSSKAFFGERLGAPEIKYGRYDSPTTGTTQNLIADGIAVNLSQNIKRELRDGLSNTMKIERLCDNAGTAVTGTATSLVWTKGSKYVEGNAVNVTVTNVVAGTYVMTASGNAVYKVVSFTQATATTKAIIELDQPFQGTTATVALATNKMVTAVLAAAANFGIKLTGLPEPYERRNFSFEKARFSVQLHDFGTTTAPVNSQEATEGVGTVEQVAQAEYELYGVNALGGNRLGIPPVTVPQVTDTTLNGYDTNYIQWYHRNSSSIIGITADSYKELVIYTNEAGTVTEWAKIFA